MKVLFLTRYNEEGGARHRDDGTTGRSHECPPRPLSCPRRPADRSPRRLKAEQALAEPGVDLHTGVARHRGQVAVRGIDLQTRRDPDTYHLDRLLQHVADPGMAEPVVHIVAENDPLFRIDPQEVMPAELVRRVPELKDRDCLPLQLLAT